MIKLIKRKEDLKELVLWLYNAGAFTSCDYLMDVVIKYLPIDEEAKELAFKDWSRFKRSSMSKKQWMDKHQKFTERALSLIESVNTPVYVEIDAVGTFHESRVYVEFSCPADIEINNKEDLKTFKADISQQSDDLGPLIR